MQNLTFSVKTESAEQFLRDNSLKSMNGRNGELNPYYLMKDELYLKQGVINAHVFGTVIIELVDYGQGSGHKLVNIYTYTVAEYDNVGVKLVLANFEVKFLEKGTSRLS